MIFDKNLTFSSKQDVSVTGYSTDTVDMGQPMPAGCHGLTLVAVAHSEAGTAPTLTVELEGSADNVTFTRITSMKKPDAPRKIFAVDLGAVNLKRYLRLRYVLGGTSPVYNVSAALVLGEQLDARDLVYPDAL